MKSLPLFLVFVIFAAACGDDAKENTDASVDSSAPDVCEGRADGAACGVAQICVGEVCGASACGDGYLDVSAGEACDDGNHVNGDGCDADCTFSCNEDADCDDANACTGVETCVEFGVGKRCQSGEAPSCVPPNPDLCIDYYCDPESEGGDPCREELEILCYLDEDGDGYPSTTTTGTVNGCQCPEDYMRVREDGLFDCNDKNPLIRPYPKPELPPEFSTLPYCADGKFAEAMAASCRDAPADAVCHKFVCEDGSDPSFDFDCNGKEALQFTRISRTGLPLCDKTCNPGPDEWLDDWRPTCGNTGSVTNCKGTVGACAAGRKAQTQGCR